MKPLIQSKIEEYPVKRGKVRDVYDVGDQQLVIVSTDRISAFDWVLPTPIPGKGKILNKISVFWLDFLSPENHLLSDNVLDMPREFQRDELEGRCMLVRKCDVIPFECIVRGFLTGSGWNEYQHSQMVGGIQMPAGLLSNTQFPRPIFTPSTKEDKGHDVNIPFLEMREGCKALYRQDNGYYIADWLKRNSIEAYSEALEYAWHRGIIIADTKFEWGMMPDGDLLLIDEVLTPDSSRLWPLSEYKINGSISSYDKQYVRDWLTKIGWDKQSEPPHMPMDVVNNTRKKYIEAYNQLTGEEWED
jgi:phosphoribosylaminoimidazole-succinocarboxamide synthase